MGMLVCVSGIFHAVSMPCRWLFLSSFCLVVMLPCDIPIPNFSGIQEVQCGRCMVADNLMLVHECRCCDSVKAAKYLENCILWD